MVLARDRALTRPAMDESSGKMTTPRLKSDTIHRLHHNTMQMADAIFSLLTKHRCHLV